MRRDHVILLAIAIAYAVAIPFIRRMQLRDSNIDPARAFLMWLAWPLTLALTVGYFVCLAVPQLLFPQPQVHKVRDRLEKSAAKKEEEQP